MYKTKQTPFPAPLLVIMRINVSISLMGPMGSPNNSDLITKQTKSKEISYISLLGVKAVWVSNFVPSFFKL